jgi:dipeptidyl aminopeptidase/acylaminoacyl peptidase
VTTEEGYRLAGTLTIPTDFPSPYPAVVLITGSHPQDRDMVGSRKEPVNKYRPFRQIADALSCRGVAVLRMDDRGYGCSEGGDINEATIPERSNDIKSGLYYLRHRKEIDKHRLGVVGISEGANIGPMIAAADPSIRALVIMAGSATNGREILEWQVRYDTGLIEGVTDEDRERILTQRMMDVEKWIAEGIDKPWRKSFVEYNPLSTARDVLCPVLIIHGDRDANVPVEHAHILAEAMRAGGNKDVTVRILPNCNHLFLKDTDGRFTDKRYWKLLHHTNKLSDGFLKILADWVSSRLRP